MEQLLELCFRRRWRSPNQSVGRGQDENPDAGFMSPHLYKERKGGPATGLGAERRCVGRCPVKAGTRAILWPQDVA